MTGNLGRLVLIAAGSNALAVAIKATILVAVTLAGGALIRKARASARHMWFAAAFGALLALPVVITLMPPVNVPVTWLGNAFVSASSTSRLTFASTVDGLTTAPLRSWRPISIVMIATVVWVAGAVIFLLPVGMGIWRTRRVRRRGASWPRGRDLITSLSVRTGIRRPVGVLLHDEIQAPMTCGLAHPVVLLPSDATQWSDADLTQALVHELEHVRRGDWLVHGMARTVCAVYWFHPLVWTAWRRLRLHAEQACDDAVLSGADATMYADQLVRLASRLSARPSPYLLSMANRSDLSVRVLALLEQRRIRGRVGFGRAAGAIVVAAVMLFAVSPLRAVGAGTSKVAAVQVQTATPKTTSEARAGAVAEAEVEPSATSQSPGADARIYEYLQDDRVVVPKVVHMTEAQYTSSGLRAKIQGTVMLEGIVEPNGTLDQIHVVRSLDKEHGLDQAALDAARSWLFEPGARDGRPVRVRVTLQIEFRLRDRVPGAASSREEASAASPASIPDDSTTTSPKLKSRVDPQYTREAEAVRLQGQVTLSVHVAADGTVSDVDVVRSLDKKYGLDEKAVEAARKWSFEPARRNGKAVPAVVEVDMEFKLQ